MGKRQPPEAPPAASATYPILLSALFGSLCVLSWLTLDPLKYIYLQHGGTAGGMELLGAFIGSFDGLDYLLLALCAALSMVLIHGELFGRRISRALGNMRPAAFRLLMLSLFAFLSHSLMTPGDLVGGDYSSHVARIAHVRFSLLAGEVPTWDNYFYLGSPLLVFTGPLYFYLGGVLDLLLREPNLTSKLILFVSQVASGAVFLLCLREHRVGLLGAAIGSLLYVGSLSHINQVLWDGNHPQALTYVFLPVSFLLLRRVLTGAGSTGTWLALTLVNATLLYHHQSMAKAVGTYLIIHALAFLAFHPERLRLRLLVPLTLSAFGSLAVGAAAIIPIVLGRDAVMMYETLSIFEWRVPTVELWESLLLWEFVPDSKTVYLGASGLVIILFGLALSLRSKGPGKPGIERWLLVSTILGLIVALTERGQHVKFMVGILFFYAFLAGVAMDRISARLGAWSATASVLVALLVFDLTSTAMQPWNRTDKGYLHTAGRHLAARPDARRTMLTHTRGQDHNVVASIGPGAGVISYYPHQNLTGAHSLAATRSHNYLATIIKRSQKDLRSRQWRPETLDLLALLNVGVIVNDTGRQMGFPEAAPLADQTPALGRHVALGGYPPSVYAPTIVRIASQEPFEKPMLWNEDFANAGQTPAMIDRFLEDMLTRMGYDRERGLAARLLVREELPKPIHRREASAGSLGKIAVRQHRVNIADASLVVDAGQAGYLRLPHVWYPTIKVSANGQPVKAVPDAMHFAVVPVTAGTTTFRIDYATMPAQRWSSLFSASSLGVVLLGAAGLRARRRRLSAGTQ